jgi:D-alanyl-D-alanine carboxypeptidase
MTRDRCFRALVAILVLATACTGARPRTGGSTIGSTSSSSTTLPAATTARSTLPPTTTTTLPPLQVDAKASAVVPASPPVRVADTRANNTRLVAGSAVTISLGGSNGIPNNATAVLLNVTITNADAAGEVAVEPEGATTLAVPSVAVGGPGDASAQLVLVALPSSGRVTLYSSVAADAFVDLEGWLVPAPTGRAAGRLQATDPVRVVDSITSVATPGPLRQGGLLDVDLSRALSGGAPSAALLRVSLFDASPLGWVTLWPTSESAPDVSHLQTPSLGWTATNLVLVPLTSSKHISIATTAPTGITVDLIATVTGETAKVALDGLVVPLDPPANVIAGDVIPPFRSDLTFGAPAQSASSVWTDVRAAHAADAGNVWLYPARTSRTQFDGTPIQVDRSTTITPQLVRVGPGEAVSLAADHRTEVSLTLRAYTIGRPSAPDPLVPAVPATPSGTAPIAGFDATIEAMLTSYGLDGGSAAVAKDGRIVYARAYGTRDVSTGGPMRIDSRFRWASMTKVVTAATLLQLVQAGGLQLDDRVFDLLADRLPLPPAHDPRLDTITVRDLLRHTSGLRSSPDPFFNEEPGVANAFGPGGPSSCDKAARWFLDFPMAGDPGGSFSYVNMNFCLAGLVIEELSGEPYGQAVRHLTLERRNARGAGTGRSHAFGANDVAHKTPPLDEPGGGRFMESIGGAGELVGSAVDLVRTIDGLDPTKPGTHLLSAEWYRELTTVQPGGGSWGLGVEVFGPNAFGHSGALDGARGAFVHQADGITWVLVVNGTLKNGRDTLGNAMKQALALVPTWPAWDYGSELP